MIEASGCKQVRQAVRKSSHGHALAEARSKPRQLICEDLQASSNSMTQGCTWLLPKRHLYLRPEATPTAQHDDSSLPGAAASNSMNTCTATGDCLGGVHEPTRQPYTTMKAPTLPSCCTRSARRILGLALMAASTDARCKAGSYKSSHF